MTAVSCVHMPAMTINLALYPCIGLGYNVTWHEIPQPCDQGMVQIDAAYLETSGLFSRQNIRQQLPQLLFLFCPARAVGAGTYLIGVNNHCAG